MSKVPFDDALAPERPAAPAKVPDRVTPGRIVMIGNTESAEAQELSPWDRFCLHIGDWRPAPQLQHPHDARQLTNYRPMYDYEVARFRGGK